MAKIGQTKIIDCTCRSEFQDQRYGPGRRVAHMRQGKQHHKGAESYRCTVCSRET